MSGSLKCYFFWAFLWAILDRLVFGLVYDNKATQIIYDSLHEDKPTADEALPGCELEEEI